MIESPATVTAAGTSRTVAIMQPYAFPYIGYFQLIRAVDAFVVYDDVAFIRRGYIHRNSILLNGGAHLFTMPIAGASQNRLICDTKFAPGPKWRASLLATMRAAYAKAPRFGEVFPVLERLISAGSDDVSTFAVACIRALCELLGIGTQIVPSSRAFGNAGLHGSERIIDICVRERARRYINPIGGAALYQRADFDARGIELRFLRPGIVPYCQFGADFVPSLSIIDVLMFNDPAALPRLLGAGELV